VKGLHLHDFGKPTAAPQLIETEPPELRPGQLAVALEASPINPSDLLLIRGLYGHRPQLPAVLGSEGVGRIVAVGDGIDAGRIGQRVLIIPNLKHGTWQDMIAVDNDDVVEVDAEADALQLAMLGVNPHTADLLLRQFGDLQPGAWVGQTAGNSAVGRYVITLARQAGYRTVSVVRRPDVASELRVLGADAVVVNGPDLADQLKHALGDERVSVLFDATAGDVVAQLAPFLVRGATVVSYGGTSGAPLAIRPSELIFRDVNVRGFWQQGYLDSAPREELLEAYSRLGALVAAGTLQVPVAATYPIEKYEDALAHASQQDRVGKVLFTW